MWFGDLVTMEWWEGIWLNEAFATFMEVLCTDAFRPQWKMWVGFGVDRDAALQIDGLHSTRPIEYEVISPDDTRGMFDVLTYEKGGSVLRMLEQYLGAETFRDGIRHYLRTHSYANTVTTDLWDALEEASGQPVRDLMNTWILQGGHPLVTLEDGQLRQQPFAYGAARGASAIGSSWLVPVLTRSLTGGPTNRHLLGDEPLEVVEELPVVLNAGGSGVFRSRYGAKELAALAGHIDELEELERATLVADSWASLFAGQITWDAFLAIAKGLGDQDEPTPWATVATAVDFVHRALDEARREKFVETVRDLFAAQFTRLGWHARAGESELTPQLRAVVLGALGTVGRDESIRSEAARLFEANALDGDLATHGLAHRGGPGPARRLRDLPRALPSRAHAPGGTALPVGSGRFRRRHGGPRRRAEVLHRVPQPGRRDRARDPESQRHEWPGGVEVLHVALGRRPGEVPAQLALATRLGRAHVHHRRSVRRRGRGVPHRPTRSAASNAPCSSRSSGCASVCASRVPSANSSRTFA